MPSLDQIINWDSFKVTLIKEFGSIDNLAERSTSFSTSFHAMNPSKKSSSEVVQDTSGQPEGHATIPQNGEPPQ